MTDPKQVLREANVAMAEGDHEGFLRHCSEDIEWEVVGEITLHGKQAVRELLADDDGSLSRFTAVEMFSEGDLLAVTGELTSGDPEGGERRAYCDVWRFRGDQMVQLRAFVIPIRETG